jgi:hypothetical protein
MLFEMDVGMVKVVEEYPKGLSSVVVLPGDKSSRPPRKVAVRVPPDAAA